MDCFELYLLLCSKFDIRAAQRNKVDAVTSVVFWDGPKGVFGDYLFGGFDGADNLENVLNRPHGSSSTLLNPVEGDTYDTTENQDVNEEAPRHGFGFQIHTSKYCLS